MLVIVVIVVINLQGAHPQKSTWELWLLWRKAGYEDVTTNSITSNGHLHGTTYQRYRAKSEMLPPQQPSTAHPVATQATYRLQVT